jgi:enamine deaminase RidA (YjgF/YER057c/UK114 family)
MRWPLRKARRSAAKAVAWAALALAATAAWPAQKQAKKDDDETQTLQLPRELPLAVAGETRRIAFHVVPLSTKGLLSQQVRDGLRFLTQQTGRDTVLHIRAFVAGAGDLRRVRDLVSETFTARRQPLPALSLVRAGGLPLPGAQVLLEAVAAGNRDVNPNGLAFFSAEAATSENPLDPVGPLTAKSLARLRQVVKAAGLEPPDIVRVTCYCSSLENLAASRSLVEAEYPGAAIDYVRPQRAPARALSACEAVARLRRPPGGRLQTVDPEGMARDRGESPAVLLNAPRVVLTGTQASFGYEEKDARLAFERVRIALEQAGASPGGVAYARYYALSTGISSQLRKVRLEFFDAARPPAGALLLWEGLPSMDTGFAVDVVAGKD